MLKKKIKLPLLLFAVVVMMSVFYIHESKQPTIPVDGEGTLNEISLNPDYATVRLANVESVNLLIEEKENLISSGSLNVDEIQKLNNEIIDLKETKYNEVALEQILIDSLSFVDVLVVLEDKYLVIDVYTEKDITPELFISVSRLAKEKFDSNYTVKVVRTPIAD